MDMRDYFKSLEGFREELKREGNPTRSPRQQRASQDNGTRQRYATGGDVKHRSRFPGGGGVGGDAEEEIRSQLKMMNPNRMTPGKLMAMAAAVPPPKRQRMRTPPAPSVPAPEEILAPAQAPPPPLQLAGPLGEDYNSRNFGMNHMLPIPEGIQGKAVRSLLEKEALDTTSRRGKSSETATGKSSKLAYNKAGEDYLKGYIDRPDIQASLKEAAEERERTKKEVLRSIPIPHRLGAARFKAATTKYGSATAPSEVTYYKTPFHMLVGAQESPTTPDRYIINHQKGFAGTKTKTKPLGTRYTISDSD